MNIADKFDQWHREAKQNRWLNLFSIFVRLALAFGFITSGMVKILGERFAAGLSVNHPMGHYLTALHETGFYYTFIGIMQVIAAILLLIPRTVVLGALIYLPIILNICILSYAVRFEGSALTSPLMTLACIFLLLWHYDKIKYIIPLKHPSPPIVYPIKPLENSFPLKFTFLSIALVSCIVALVLFGWEIEPRNHIKDCNSQFLGTKRIKAGAVFCDCIHNQGLPLDTAIKRYKQVPND